MYNTLAHPVMDLLRHFTGENHEKLILIAMLSIICAVLATSQTKLCDCTRENVTSVGFLNSNTPIVQYYTDTEGFVSTVREYYIDIGERTLGPYDEPIKLIISPNRTRWAFKTEINGKCYIISDEEEMGPYINATFEFSADNKLVREVCEGWYRYIVVDGNKSYPCRDIYPVASKYGEPIEWLAPDGKTVVYTYRRDDNKKFIAYGFDAHDYRSELGPFYDIGNTSFAPNGEVLYIADNGDSRWHVFIQEKEIGDFNGHRGGDTWPGAIS